MRFLRLLFCVAFLCFGGLPAKADDFYGSPAVLSSGLIMLEGRDVNLWGVAMLANDQQCWHENRAWDCGDQAFMALRHFIANHLVHCVTKADLGGGHMAAQCYRQENGGEQDIAHYMISEGWARDNADISGGYYAYDQNEARQNRRGIWTSRFQTTEDWKNGVQRYVPYDAVPQPTVIENAHITNTTISQGGGLIILQPENGYEHHEHQEPPLATTTATPLSTAPLTAPLIHKGAARQSQFNADQPQ